MNAILQNIKHTLLNENPKFLALSEVTHFSKESLNIYIAIAKLLLKYDIINTFSLEQLAYHEGLMYDGYIHNKLPKGYTAEKVILETKFGGISSHTKMFAKFLEYLKKQCQNGKNIHIVGGENVWFFSDVSNIEPKSLHYILPKSDYNFLKKIIPKTFEYPTKKKIEPLLKILKNKQFKNGNSEIIRQGCINGLKYVTGRYENIRYTEWQKNLLNAYNIYNSMFVFGYHLGNSDAQNNETIGYNIKTKLGKDFESWGMTACYITVYLSKNGKFIGPGGLEKYCKRTNFEEKMCKHGGYKFVKSRVRENEIRNIGVSYDIQNNKESAIERNKIYYDKVIVIKKSDILKTDEKL